MLLYFYSFEEAVTSKPNAYLNRIVQDSLFSPNYTDQSKQDWQAYFKLLQAIAEENNQ